MLEAMRGVHYQSSRPQGMNEWAAIDRAMPVLLTQSQPEHTWCSGLLPCFISPRALGMAGSLDQRTVGCVGVALARAIPRLAFDRKVVVPHHLGRGSSGQARVPSCPESGLILLIHTSCLHWRTCSQKGPRTTNKDLSSGWTRSGRRGGTGTVAACHDQSHKACTCLTTQEERTEAGANSR